MKQKSKKKKKSKITITTVNAPGGWLSCMSAYLVQYIGIMFRTCEALFHTAGLKVILKFKKKF